MHLENHYRRDATSTSASSSSSSLPTNSLGCVICPSVTQMCVKCKKGESCQQRVQTCQTCPSYYCAPIDNSSSSSSSSSSTPTGGIVGGVIGGVLLIALFAVGFWYYKYVYRKRVSLDDSDDVMMNTMEEISEYDGKEDTTSATSPGTASGAGAAPGSVAVASSTEKPPTRRVNSNQDIKAKRRLSSYESFTRPKTKRAPQSKESAQRRARQKQIVDRANTSLSIGRDVYIDPNSPNRNSVATSISTTNASNILPIAYIPGVTVRPTKNNTRSIYSYDTDSVFSDLNTIENASIIGDVMRANNATAPVQTGVAENKGVDTMTAIKAQPRLVNVDRIEEEEEDETDAEEYPKNEAASVETDSDVDSDIGEIARVKDVKDLDEGSFILDVEMGQPRREDNSLTRERSPFDDPQVK